MPPAGISPRQPETTFESWVEVYGLRLGDGVLAERIRPKKDDGAMLVVISLGVRLTIQSTTTLAHAAPLTLTAGYAGT